MTAVVPLEERVMRTLRLRLRLRLWRRRLVGVVRRGAAAPVISPRRMPRPLAMTSRSDERVQMLLPSQYLTSNKMSEYRGCHAGREAAAAQIGVPWILRALQ